MTIPSPRPGLAFLTGPGGWILPAMLAAALLALVLPATYAFLLAVAAATWAGIGIADLRRHGGPDVPRLALSRVD